MSESQRAGDHQADDSFNLAPAEGEPKRIPREILDRRGQAEFRATLISEYGGKCAVTGCDASDALEAAHIAPYCITFSNHVANGLLLRADIHTLFDLDLIGIDPNSFNIVLSQELGQSSYADLHGKALAVPPNTASRPNKDALAERWQQFRAK